ncbi:MAG: FAD:protein FMN transferase [Clostridium fessum]
MKRSLTTVWTCRQNYENRFSKTIEGSEALQVKPPQRRRRRLLPSPDDMAAMISEGLHYSEVSHGAYDLTIEPLSSLWNFTSDGT